MVVFCFSLRAFRLLFPVNFGRCADRLLQFIAVLFSDLGYHPFFSDCSSRLFISMASSVPSVLVLGHSFIRAFPPALFDQLVQRVAAEVTRQLQPASFLPAVQEPQVPSPAPAAFPSLAGTTDIQQLTTEVPVVSSSPVGNPSAVDQVT